MGTPALVHPRRSPGELSAWRSVCGAHRKGRTVLPCCRDRGQQRAAADPLPAFACVAAVACDGGAPLRSCPPPQLAAQAGAPPLLRSAGHPHHPLRHRLWRATCGHAAVVVAKDGGYRAQRSKGGAAGCAADCGGGHERSPVPGGLGSPEASARLTASGRRQTPSAARPGSAERHIASTRAARHVDLAGPARPRPSNPQPQSLKS